MSDFLGLHSALEKHIAELDAKFIKPHIPTSATTTPDTYDLDVRAYCVLSHAALEQYIEEVALALAVDAEKAWLQSKALNRTLLGLIAFQQDRLPIEDKEVAPEVSFFNRIRTASEDAKATLSAYLTDNNHGVSAKYLRRMLLPVGIDVPDGPVWLNSLRQLAKQRGDTAHKWKVTKIPSPKDAWDWVQDCLKMCAHVRDDARAVLCQPAFEEDHRHYVL